MADLTRDAAFLVKRGVPYDEALAMPAEKASAAVRLFRELELEAKVKRLLWALAIWATLLIGVGFLAAVVATSI